MNNPVRYEDFERVCNEKADLQSKLDNANEDIKKLKWFCNTDLLVAKNRELEAQLLEQGRDLIRLSAKNVSHEATIGRQEKALEKCREYLSKIVLNDIVYRRPFGPALLGELTSEIDSILKGGSEIQRLDSLQRTQTSKSMQKMDRCF
jgi:hypothetical protein